MSRDLIQYFDEWEQVLPPDAREALRPLVEKERAVDANAVMTMQAMADCMDMVRQELIEADVIDKSVPPMFITEAILAQLKGRYVPRNFTTHRTAWRDAITECINAETNAGRPDAAGYWKHELEAYDRSFARLLDKPEPVKARVAEDCDCGCNDPVATTPRDMLEFLANRFEMAGVTAAVGSIYAHDIRKILAGIGWISVKKQKPPFDELVLVYNANASKHDARWGVARRQRGSRYADQQWYVEVGWEWAPIGTPTHWQPLPDLPGADGPVSASSHLYTCIGKGGEYEVVDQAKPAGELRELVMGEELIVYRDQATQAAYVRIRSDFDRRMECL